MSSVKVAVRVRPSNRREINHKSRCIIQMVDDKTGWSPIYKQCLHALMSFSHCH